ncbi:hypothetical protein Slin15195_G102430 [Septoria linicola]|uniref:Uncharacterized protein n=1 Tax=Septoria linicola TaxID=215465 RepID=A0A9Q9ENS8_9PEZI|nr:hypothetical protein Slin14017_G065430 [Septoria linicola]USW56924.1 hypothetical protein Slin15195_G102430 [Septoria linicola]
MGQDLYKWDEGGVLKHHCPICQTPLSHEKCRTTCLGKHVEWCHRYHSLFRINWATRCNACKTCDEQHEKRHRDIAEILHKIKKVKAEEEAAAVELLDSPATPKVPRVPLTVKALNTIDGPPAIDEGQKTTKKERKMAKKVAKALDRDKFVTTADILRVAKVLHPTPEQEAEQADVEAEGMAEDEEIRWNLRFNYSTCNTKSIRHDFIIKERCSQHQIPEADMESLLEQLEVDINAVGKEGELVQELIKAIKSDLQNFQDEVQSTARSKAGFWRWANKKHYRALLDRGKEWDDKHKPTERSDCAAVDERRDSAAPTEPELEGDISPTSSRRGSLGVLTLSTSGANSTDGTVLTMSSTLEEHEPAKKVPVLSLRIPSAPSKSAESAPVGDPGWTQVGKKLLKSPPKGKIILAGNGGLQHLHQKPKDRFGALSWAETAKGE